MNLTTANASALLTATAKDWRDGLGKSTSDMKLNVRRMAHLWHPDHNKDPEAGDVFARLQEARAAWHLAAQPKVQIFFTDRGTRLELRYQKNFDNELGETYIGRSTLMTAYRCDVADLTDNAIKASEMWTFATPEMRKQISPLLPQAASVYTTPERVVHVSKRDPALVRLVDLVAYLGLLDPHHVAWIGSGLWNLACYFQHAGFAHQAISAENVWVDPLTHRVALLGGWAYSGILGQRWKALPARTLHAASHAILDGKVFSETLDHILIRELLRELLGDPNGMGANLSTPDALAAFTRLPAGGTAAAQYAAWKQALLTSFGKPKFVELDIPSSLIYPEN